ncbi:N-acetyl sugar amidotransferase [Peteryoungia algae]|uniref:N-acetyl sugar amidotransferase n=1 Tax=Peteryoungia algae TaxID=2919917 RepID=A0ABT0CZV8_9HYPH|nr:N-acetyl sugar amidotransferase [Rhizobium sp. SSM4.3]MCJ8238703.1 N-acetyl sugar amidotransferase [Rhizobium sp. SSM4.3]
MIVCTRCIYDETVPNVSFDPHDGVCNYCRQIEGLEAEYPTGAEGKARLEKMVDDIKAAGRGKKYDAIIGVSGGCDSSYLVHQMKEVYGLRLLAAHFDNTWNSTVATENIQNVLEKLNVDLFTVVVDNKEYDDIYRSFLQAGVKDIDIPTDIALATTLYRAAEKFGIKYMIEGHSFRTEGVAPLGWVYMDGKYIQSVHNQFGKLPMKTFPNLWLKDQLRWMLFGGIKKVRPIYYLDYDKEAAKQLLAEKYGWQWYGGHHLENRFTAFVHSYFFPQRWGIDFRIAGFSAYCRNGWMTREEAMDLMRQPPHIEAGLVDFVRKRLGYSDGEFEQIMNLPKKNYTDFDTYKKTFETMRPFFWAMYKMDLVPKSFYMKYTAKS